MKLLKKYQLWIEGLSYAFAKDNNLVIQIIIITSVLVGLEVFLESWELIKQTILFGVTIIILELINTTIELICDFMEPKWNVHIKRIKDIGSSIVALAIITAITITSIDIWLLIR